MAPDDSTWNAAARAEDLAQRCAKAQATKAGWQACCPAHDDRSPSLSITAQGDTVLLHCHAGCEPAAVLAALGLEMAALFPPRPPRLPPPPRRRFQAPSPPPTTDDAPAPPAASPPPPGPPRVIATYDYEAANAQLLYQVQRWEPGRHGQDKSFTQRRPHPTRAQAWINNMTGVQKVLFNLPAVRRAVQAAEVIYLPEGEKDVLNLIAQGLTATTNAGGAAPWEPQYTETLRGAHVVLLQDNDASGRRHTARVTQALHGVAASLRVLLLPGLPPKGDVSDWLAAGGTRAQLEALVAAPPLWEPPAAEAAAGETDDRPVIPITPHLPALIDALQAVLRAQEPPWLYVHADRLCVLRRHQGGQAPGSPPGVGGLYLADLTRPHLTELASGLARWEKYDQRQRAWRHALPSDKALEGFLARGQWPFPELSGLLTAPTLRPDGSVLDTPGYDAATGLYYDPQGVTFPPLPAQPDIVDARSAIEQLREVFVDFLYPDPAYFATVLAAVLSLACRHAIRGNVPLFGVTATTRASGKGLLVDAVALIGTGRRAPKWTQTRDEEEERKQLLALALEGEQIVCIDNCAYPLGSPGLDLVLTAGMAKGRVLGQTATTTAALHAVFFATGNNLQYRGDLGRRVVPIRLDPQMEKPEERAGFRHPQLLAWVAQERPRLLVAALTVLRAYFTAGCQAQGLTPYGSFEAWSDTVRSALVWAGEPDPAHGRAGLDEEADPQYEALGQLLTAWEACYQRTPQTLTKAAQDATLMTQDKLTPLGPWHDLREALGALDPRFDGTRLNMRAMGQTIKALAGRIVGGKRLVKAGSYAHRTLWKIETSHK